MERVPAPFVLDDRHRRDAHRSLIDHGFILWRRRCTLALAKVKRLVLLLCPLRQLGGGSTSFDYPSCAEQASSQCPQGPAVRKHRQNVELTPYVFAPLVLELAKIDPVRVLHRSLER